LSIEPPSAGIKKSSRVFYPGAISPRGRFRRIGRVSADTIAWLKA
jgi:hypothetical protein